RGGGGPVSAGGARLALDIDPLELHETYRSLSADGYRLALVAAHDDAELGAASGELRVVYLLVAGPPDARIELNVRVPAANPRLPTLADLSFPASRFERELRDL